MINRIELPKEIIIASHNPGKVKEINILLNDIGIKAYPISLFSDIEPIENGSSFSENALIKARNARQLSNKTSLADDSGLCVDALDGAPGIYSARWGVLSPFPEVWKMCSTKCASWDLWRRRSFLRVTCSPRLMANTLWKSTA